MKTIMSSYPITNISLIYWKYHRMGCIFKNFIVNERLFFDVAFVNIL